jgi:hypothetical protein
MAASARLACHWSYAPIDIDDEEVFLAQNISLPPRLFIIRNCFRVWQECIKTDSGHPDGLPIYADEVFFSPTHAPWMPFSANP